MAISAFAEKEHPPSFDEVCGVLGSNQNLWLELNAFMLEYYGLPGEWKYGGKKYGWIVSFRRGSKTIVSFYPQIESITVQLVLGQTLIPQALNLKLSNRTRERIQETPQLHDGRWLFLPVKTARDAHEVEQLILIKAPRKHRSPAT